ncbi:hypothetical protein ACOSQ4_031602 [Xanthoceras sorbifolium]
MAQPVGFVDLNKPTHVCRLCKAIYSLKQAFRAWYHELRQFLLESGFHNSHSDTSLFVLISGGLILFLLVYVNDIIIIGNDDRAVHTFIQVLTNQFSLKDLGPISFFLGVGVVSLPHGLLLFQHRYILNLLAHIKMVDAKPVVTPLITTPTLTLHVGTTLSDPT